MISLGSRASLFVFLLGFAAAFPSNCTALYGPLRATAKEHIQMIGVGR
jgi:hypothetical protein